jgi:para-aminobenzoate synthetase component 1
MSTLLQDRAAPLVEELTGLEPWDAFVRLVGLPHVLMLDSALPSEAGRYSFVTGDPFHWLEASGAEVTLDGRPLASADPLTALQQQWRRHRIDTLPELPPFQGGAAGLFGYDLCHHIERLPRPCFDDLPTPDLAVGFYDWVISFDHHQERAWLISTGLPEAEPRRRWRRAGQRREQVLRWLEHGVSRSWSPSPPRPLQAPCQPVESLPGVLSNFTRAEYQATVQRAIDYVHAGDCFQVNVAQRLLTPQRLPPWLVYQRLRQGNPAPFAGYFDLGESVIASASPERFLRLNRGAVETRPIKGTRPRGDTPGQDRDLAG